MGSTDATLEGYYNLAWVPDIDPPNAQNGAMFVVVTTEAINPLYTGAHAVGPYVLGSVEPSGAPESQLLDQYALGPLTYGGAAEFGNFAPGDAASNCNTGGDGVEADPLPVAAGGWWTDVLCGRGHAAWSSLHMQAGRTATLEVTALDESGFATTAKAMPLIGVWGATDPTGTLPTVVATPSAFNTISLGMTAAGVASSQAGGWRFVVADARGDGRPDFAYQARVLYADSIQPAATSVNGGQITISGMGFRAGNEVLVNGVPAVVSSWSASSIVAVAPLESVFGTAPTGPVDVEVVDLATGGTAVMTGALTYSSSVKPDEMALISSPSGAVAVGTAAAAPFAVRMTLGDGLTPVVGLPVTFASTTGNAQLGACGAATCVVLTDATGLASITVTPTAFGTVTVQATAVGATQIASFSAVARSISAMQPVEYVAAGATVAWTPEVTVVQNDAPALGVTVAWAPEVTAGAMTLASGASTTNAAGVASISAVVGPLAAGAQAAGQACVWATVCAGFAAVGIDPSAWRVVVMSGAGQSIAAGAAFAPVVAMVTCTRR